MKVKVICSGCGKEYEVGDCEFGLPCKFYKCECGAETRINLDWTTAFWWEGFWVSLVNKMEDEFGRMVGQKMVEHLKKKRLEKKYSQLYEELNILIKESGLTQEQYEALERKILEQEKTKRTWKLMEAKVDE